MNIVEYDPSRRAEVAALMGRVWGERPLETELEWLYERNPVRPASVLLAEEDGEAVGTVAVSFQRMAIGGQEVEVGVAIHLATDPAHQGRGIFSALQAANEERVRELGVGLLLVVPNAASAGVLQHRLGWGPLPPIRVWARVKVLRTHPGVPPVARFGDHVRSSPVRASGDRVLRDAAWLNWRFRDGPRAYTLLDGGDFGYAAVGRRGRVGVVAVLEGELYDDVAAVALRPLFVASPPPHERPRYALAGYVPTRRTFTVLGKSLGRPLPERPHFELGDLDFL